MIYRCQHESRNFAFEAFGRTEGEALWTFVSGLKRHAAATAAHPSWAAEVIADTRAEPVEFGVFYRDREALK